MKHTYNILIILLILFSPCFVNGQGKVLNIIAFGAHPDDCDSKFGGTAILYAQMGHRVKFVSLTDGDKGHQTMGGGALAKRRVAEAKEAGRRFGVEYEVLDNHDGELRPSLENRLKIIRKIREWDADIVLTHRSNDYHPDHRYTSILVQDAAYLVIVPNIAPDTPPLKKNPVFLYFQDRFEKPNPFTPDIAIDIDEVIKKKAYALAAHESQYFEWMPWTSGTLDQIPKGEYKRIEWLMNRIDRRRIGQSVNESVKRWYGNELADGVKHAEAFEICEFGRHPSEEELRSLFPMIESK